MAALSLGVLAAHHTPPLGDWLPSVTTRAARAIGLAPTFLEDCPFESLLSSNARDTSELLASAGSGLQPLAGALS